MHHLGRNFGKAVADEIARRLLERLEQEGALPLESRLYDVVVDDPQMASRHEYRGVTAISAQAAAVEGYRRAMRDEGFRCIATLPSGDEQTVEAMGRECSMWATVHLHRKHPQIDYDRREEVARAVA